MRLFDKVYAYTWGRAFYDSSNCYIIRDDECVLIDPGTFKSYTNLFGLMRNDGIERVDFVFNTHLHRDHCESNVMFMGKGALLGFDERDREVSQFSFSSDLKLGRTFVVGNTEIEVIRTPGHSPGSLTFYLQEFGIAITGDLIFEGGVVGRFDVYGSDRKQMIRSLERIRSLEAEYIMPGHKRVMQGREGIDMLIERGIEFLTFY
ncbi:MBL fold metallo-hydrolase [Archaeoglobus neptunius]|uniref:MBL fold metallo-hydrolase n=1 Tax=Archaeoglobus neptunius TaxID=2798580 RepID=UPI001928012B|nr:MBL fold metallo-hydrolase [Archaeoglobus neptunius]